MSDPVAGENGRDTARDAAAARVLAEGATRDVARLEGRFDRLEDKFDRHSESSTNKLDLLKESVDRVAAVAGQPCADPPPCEAPDDDQIANVVARTIAVERGREAQREAHSRSRWQALPDPAKVGVGGGAALVIYKLAELILLGAGGGPTP